MGIRSALGARGHDLMSLVLREGAILISIGIAIGGAVAASTTRLLTGFFYEIGPTDPATFTIVALVPVVVMFIATVLPGPPRVPVGPVDSAARRVGAWNR